MNKGETKSASGHKQTSQQQTGQGRGNQPLKGSPERGIERRGSYSPSLFSLSDQQLFGASPFEIMRRFSEEMERIFSGFGLSARGMSRGGVSQMSRWSPAIDVFQRENNLVVRADLPGINKEDVKIEMTDDGLVIRGESKQEHEEREEGFYRSERSYGQFYRLIPLPEEIDPDQVRAEFTNGVLEITAPIPERETRRREIPIGTEGKQSKAASTRS